MHCPHPKPVGNTLRSCGGCYACRINDRRVWTGRLLLESFFYPETSFVTLTYEDQFVPQKDGVQILDRKDYRRFIRQFSRSPFGSPRWYGVGEYGDDSQRPHYHFILFGVGVGWSDEIVKAWSKPIKAKNVTSKMVKEKRVFRDHRGRLYVKIGFVTIEPLCPERAAYACGYVVKKMTAEDDTRLKGRPPEFRSMSKQYGGIGYCGLGWLADMQFTKAGCRSLAQSCDVFDSIRVEGKIYPIGDYLRSELRKIVNVPETPLERRALYGEPSGGDEVVCAPFDLASVRQLPRNQRIINAEKIEITPTALARIEAVQRKKRLSKTEKI